MNLLNLISLNPAEKLGSIEIIIGDNDFSYNLVILEKSKKTLNILEYHNDINSFDELLTTIPKNLPVILSVTGKGIIFKKLKNKNYNNDLEILNDVLPNVTLKEFELRKCEIDDEFFFAIVIRKQLIDKIFTLFDNQKLFILDIRFGPFDIQNVLPYVNLGTKEIFTSVYKLTTSESKIESVVSNSQNISNDILFDEESINNNSLIAFANGFSFLVLKREQQGSFDTIDHSSKEFKYYKTYKKLSIGTITFLFIALLINYFVFDNFHSRYNNISGQLDEYQGLLSSFTRKQEEFKEKKEIISKTGMTEISRISQFADQLANNLPNGISFTKMNFYPISKRNSRTKEFDFGNDQLILSGLANTSTTLNEWIQTLNDFKWIDEVNDFTFSRENEETNELIKFDLNIAIKE